MAVSSDTESRRKTLNRDGYAALVGDAGAYEDSARQVFELVGAAPLKALHGLVTADLQAAGEADAAFPSLILTPKGRVMADAVIVRCGGTALLDVPRAAWPQIEAHFARYLPPRLARLEPSGLRLVRIRGPGALDRERNDAALATLDGATYSERDGSRWDVTPYLDGFATRPPESLDLYLPEGAPTGMDLPPVTDAVWDVWRIERGIPIYGRDVSEDNLPQETGMVAERVSFVKGCYTGQEVLARIHYRGKVNRHLRGIRLDDAEGAEAAPNGLAVGDVLRTESKEVGRLTSAGWSPTYGWIGLGYLRREVEPGTEVTVQRMGDIDPAGVGPSWRALVTDLPFSD